MAIHEQNYVLYDGPLRRTSSAWVIAYASLRMYLSQTRTKLTMLFLWTMPLITAVLVFVEYTVRASVLKESGIFDKPPEAWLVLGFMQFQIYSLVVLFAAVGGGVIADDLRYKTIQLYFSKPLGKLDYALGKFLGLFLLGAVITTLPALLLTVMRGAFFSQVGHFLPVMGMMVGATVLITLATALLSIIMMGLSSLSENSRYVVLLWLGFILIPMILGSIIGAMNNSSDLFNLFGFPGSLWLIERVLLDGAQLDIPAALPFLVIGFYSGLGFLSVYRRISSLEGVA